MDIELEDIAYHLTSTMTKPNKIMREEILPFFRGYGVNRILDFGCGRYLRDSVFLSSKGFVVDALDLEEQIINVKEEERARVNSLSSVINRSGYDAVLLNFVIQVLPTDKQRTQVLGDVAEAVRKNGYLVLSSRNASETNNDDRIPYNDGFLMKRGRYCTFMRGYHREEMKDIIKNLGFTLLQLHSTSSSFIALGQKA